MKKEQNIIAACFIAAVMADPVFCRAQVKSVQKATPKINPPALKVKLDTSKLKPATPAVIRPKETHTADVRPVKGLKYGSPPAPAKADKAYQVNEPRKARGPIYRQVPDSNHRYSPHRVMLKSKALKSGQSSRSAINPQPLPPKNKSLAPARVKH